MYTTQVTNFLTDLWHGGEKILPSKKTEEFSRYFLFKNVVYLYVDINRHMRVKFQMPVNGLIFCSVKMRFLTSNTIVLFCPRCVSLP